MWKKLNLKKKIPKKLLKQNIIGIYPEKRVPPSLIAVVVGALLVGLIPIF